MVGALLLTCSKESPVLPERQCGLVGRDLDPEPFLATKPAGNDSLQSLLKELLNSAAWMNSGLISRQSGLSGSAPASQGKPTVGQRGSGLPTWDLPAGPACSPLTGKCGKQLEPLELQHTGISDFCPPHNTQASGILC